MPRSFAVKRASAPYRILLVGLVPLVAAWAFAACAGGPSGPAGSTFDAASEAEAGDDRYNFDPRRYRRDCERDEDCVILMSLSQCSSCCGFVSLRRGDADRDYAAVESACQSAGGPVHGGCGLYCPTPRAACFEQICVRLPADAGSDGATNGP